MVSLCKKSKSSLKSGLPRNWPYSTEEDIEDLPQRIIKFGLKDYNKQLYQYKSNAIKTSKYEFATFIPIFLFEEFNPMSKVANVFFLVICALQCIGPISNTGGYPTTLIPLLVIVFIDGIFSALEDLARHRADKLANVSITHKYDSVSKTFIDCSWSTLSVGDFVKVYARESIPADLLVFEASKSAGSSPGICYVETKSLDGETNLKVRNIFQLPKHQKFPIGTLFMDVSGGIEMEHPNNFIDSFVGVMSFDIGGEGTGGTVSVRQPIQPSNLLLRGCVLRNNDWIIGVVLNTGHDTKIMMTSLANSRMKYSNLEVQCSKQIRSVILMLVTMGIVGSFGQLIWNSVNKADEIPYLLLTEDPGVNWIVSFFYFLLLHASIIPVSLYISISVTRFCQSYFMNTDLEMYYDKTDTPAMVRTANLNEELGQISHIFSDKTGTLTSNIMDFRKASINGVIYGEGITEIGKASWKLQGKKIPQAILDSEEKAKENAVPHVTFYCSRYLDDMTNNPGQRQAISAFFTALSICHDAIKEKTTKRNVQGGEDIDVYKLSASNPDDEALVCASEYFGFEFTGREGGTVMITQAVQPVSILQSMDRFKRPSNAYDIRVRNFSSCESNQEGAGNNEEVLAISNNAKSSSVSNLLTTTVKPSAIASTSSSPSRSLSAEDHVAVDDDVQAFNAGDCTGTGASTTIRFEVLQSITFSSKRKRMSVIGKYINSNNTVVEEAEYVTLFCKGAETVIYPRLSKTQHQDQTQAQQSPGKKSSGASRGSSPVDVVRVTDQHISDFSIEGLRCLLITSRRIPLHTYSEWMSKYDNAKANLDEIEKYKNGKQNLIEELENEIEMELQLLGATGIEDRLQEGVPECIEALSKTGMKIWVLTGDKEETAINIAVACNLVRPSEYMDRIIINPSLARSPDDILKLMQKEITRYDDELAICLQAGKKPKPRALILDGPTLVTLMASEPSASRKQSVLNVGYWNSKKSFKGRASKSTVNVQLQSSDSSGKKGMSMTQALLELTKRCSAVVGCRVSPDQKREMVALIRNNIPGVRTLAVGDGANDVAMIKEAHIGVGIKGEEGLQAVNSSDYAIAQFRYLTPLLLKHGRFNYIRLSGLICFIFYKNLLCTLSLFLFNVFNGFSGQKMYTEAALQGFNVFYTCFPILSFAMYDMDVDHKLVYKNPGLYQDCINNSKFNSKVFWYFMITAVIESVFVAILPFYFMDNSGEGNLGMISSFWEIGFACFTTLLITSTIQIFSLQNQYHWIHALLVLGSIGIWFVFAMIISFILPFDYEWHGVLEKCLANASMWLTIIVIVTAIVVKEIFIVAISRAYFFNTVQILQEISYLNSNNIHQSKVAVDPSMVKASIDSSS